MPDRGWKCASCRAMNDRARVACENCGWQLPVAAAPAEATRQPLHVCSPDPETGCCDCGRRFNTREQGKALSALVRAVIAREVTAEQAKQEMEMICREEESTP